MKRNGAAVFAFLATLAQASLVGGLGIGGARGVDLDRSGRSASLREFDA